MSNSIQSSSFLLKLALEESTSINPCHLHFMRQKPAHKNCAKNINSQHKEKTPTLHWGKVTRESCSHAQLLSLGYADLPPKTNKVVKVVIYL